MRVEPVQAAEQTQSVTLTGIIFRDERVVYGESGGGVIRLYANGEKVSKNATVARVYDTFRSEDYALTSLDRKISILTDSNKVSDNTTKNLDAKINRLYYTIRLKSEQGDFSSVAEKTDELLVLLNRREILVNARLNFNAEIAEYKARRDELISSGSGLSTEVKTPVSGYFSSCVDGYENLFTAKAATELSYEDLAELMDQPAQELSVTKDGYAVGKIAHDSKWYLCAVTDKDTAYKLTEGEKYTVAFPTASGSEKEFTLMRIITQNGGNKAVIVFGTDIQSRELGEARKQTVSLVMERIEGLRVPVSAVRTDEENHTGVYILKNNKVTFRKIEILSEKDGYCIVKEYAPDEEGYSEMLHKYDSLIISGKGLKEAAEEADGETTDYEIRIFG